MKPKTRYQQKQEGRLYLRDNDHRDIVLDDAYVNALWLKKDNKDELVWQRYPRLYNIMLMRDSGGRYYTILDIDREFAHFHGIANTMYNLAIIKLDDLLLWYWNTSEENQFHVSLNGLNWSTFSPYVSYGYMYKKFGNDNSMVSTFKTSQNVNQISFPKIHFEIDEETKNITMYQSSFSVIFPTYVYDYRYICDTANGMLIITRENGSNVITIYEVTEQGALLCDSMTTQYPDQMVNQYVRGCRKGSFYAYAWLERDLTSNVVISTSNDMTHWNHTTIFRGESTSVTPYIHLCQRNGYFYLYVCYSNVMHAWKSATGEEWIELNLLDYVDVKCCKDGARVSSAYDKIRIILNAGGDIPSDSTPYVNVSELLGDTTENIFQDNFNNIMMQDGKFAEWDEEYLGLGGYISNVYCAVYFDNMIFTPSEHNMALLSATYNEANGYEHIMEGDYCYTGTQTIEEEI